MRPFGDAKLVAVNGRLGFEETFIWGEIAATARQGFGVQPNSGATGRRRLPKTTGSALIGDEPTLILLDELPPYFDYAITRQVGGGTLANVTTYALSNLLTAALKLKRCCIVVSNLSGSYEGATKQLRQAIRNFEQEANRQARAVTPVDLATSRDLRNPAQAAVQKASGPHRRRQRRFGLRGLAVGSGEVQVRRQDG